MAVRAHPSSCSIAERQLVPCRLPRGCGEIGIHAVFRWRWANARGGSSPLSRTPLLVWGGRSLPLSSRGLGRRPLTAETGVRIPVAVLHDARPPAGFVVLEQASQDRRRRSRVP